MSQLLCYREESREDYSECWTKMTVNLKVFKICFNIADCSNWTIFWQNSYGQCIDASEKVKTEGYRHFKSQNFEGIYWNSLRLSKNIKLDYIFILSKIHGSHDCFHPFFSIKDMDCLHAITTACLLTSHNERFLVHFTFLRFLNSDIIRQEITVN